MKFKILNAAIVATSVMAYLEWGKKSNMFLLTVEADIIAKLFTNPSSVLHPFILIPLAGQLMLIATLFQNKPGKALTYTGMGCIGVLLLLIFAIGIMQLRVKILLSTLPFIITCIITIMFSRQQARHSKSR